MSYTDIIVIILSFLSIFICLFSIWLAIIFFRLHTQFSLIVTEMAKGLDISTIRLERLPKILYNKELGLMKKTLPDNQIIKEKEEQNNTPKNTTVSHVTKPEKDIIEDKKQDAGLEKQILLENEII